MIHAKRKLDYAEINFNDENDTNDGNTGLRKRKGTAKSYVVTCKKEKLQ
jgi:hypothetical protein